MRQQGHPLRDQHQRDGAHQYAAAEGNHEVAQLLVQPARQDALDLGQTRPDRYAGARKRRPQQQFSQSTHSAMP